MHGTVHASTTESICDYVHARGCDSNSDNVSGLNWWNNVEFFDDVPKKKERLITIYQRIRVNAFYAYIYI